MCPAQRFQEFSIRKTDLIAANLNRLQQRNVAQPIK